MTVEELKEKVAQCEKMIAQTIKQTVEQFEADTGVMIREVEIQGPHRKTDRPEYFVRVQLHVCL